MKKIIPMLALSLFVLPTTIKADALNPIIQNDWQTETVNLFISDSINIMLFNSSLKLARMGLDMTHCDAADYLDKIYREIDETIRYKYYSNMKLGKTSLNARDIDDLEYIKEQVDIMFRSSERRC